MYPHVLSLRNRQPLWMEAPAFSAGKTVSYAFIAALWMKEIAQNFIDRPQTFFAADFLLLATRSFYEVNLLNIYTCIHRKFLSKQPKYVPGFSSFVCFDHAVRLRFS